MKLRTDASTILLGGAIAGALDLLFATTFAGFNGVAPTRVLQTIASGLLGNAAFAGGAGIAILGLLLHFAITCVLAGLFLLVARRAPLLGRWPVWSGIVFGIGVFLVMRLVVLPLSAYPRPVTFRPLATVLDLLSHMLLVGVPISLVARKRLGA